MAIGQAEISLYPSASGSFAFAANVTNSVQRLGALITLPTINVGGANVRIPRHVMFQLISTALNPVYYTADEQTNPTAAAGSIEIRPGDTHRYYNAFEIYKTHAQTGFKFIGPAASTLLTVHFWD